MKPISIDSFDILSEVSNWWQQFEKSRRSILDLADAEPGATPRESVLEIERFKLLRFVSDAPAQKKIPLLISYALVNRFVIADLQEDKSLVRRLLEQGYAVYVLDWGYPRASDRMLDLDTYINEYTDAAVDFLRSEHGVDAINVLGICQGGTMALTYAALHPKKIHCLITMVTPVDFHTEKDRLSQMVQDIDVAGAVRALGNVPGLVLNANFNAMQPFSLNIKKWLDSVNTLQDPSKGAFFLRMEQWINDSPDQAGQAHQEFITQFYQQNRIMKNTVIIGDERVDYKAVDCPILNLFGSYDHLVPPDSSRAIKKVVGSKDYTEIELPTGHIGMYVSRAATQMPEKISAWLEQKG